jgi:hypothetical protein
VIRAGPCDRSSAPKAETESTSIDPSVASAASVGEEVQAGEQRDAHGELSRAPRLGEIAEVRTHAVGRVSAGELDGRARARRRDAGRVVLPIDVAAGRTDLDDVEDLRSIPADDHAVVEDAGARREVEAQDVARAGLGRHGLPDRAIAVVGVELQVLSAV